ncbi:MAG: tRNA (guanosine(37)-N1)-methyltransferase TrmD [Candidatus Heteroscillospira sp.]|jgi:tRNA (guanine37-N1)-methyltransferase
MSGMRIDIMTLFPDSVSHVLGESIIGRAAKKGIIEINAVQIRDFTENKQCQVDDYPYGGGWGCVMMAQPLKSCLEHITAQAGERKRRVIYLSPQGRPYTQTEARRLKDNYDHLVLVCGHYEGIDERFIEECVDEELSLGDFVLTGGEIAAMAVADSVCRMVPGVLADEECFTGESHWDGLLEYPQYTRPEVWEGRAVPPVLLSGNHENVRVWRREKSIERTMDKRPDMFEKLDLSSKEDRRLLENIRQRREPKKRVFDYRRGMAADLPEIMAVAESARAFLKSQGLDQWQTGYPAESDYANDIEKGWCWVFEEDGKIVSVMAVVPEPDPGYEHIDGAWKTAGDYVAVHRVAVSADCRGSGVASQMFELAGDLCLGWGRGSLRIDTHPGNRPMRKLLGKCGFEECGAIRLVGGVEDGQLRLAFEKVLQWN